MLALVPTGRAAIVDGATGDVVSFRGLLDDAGGIAETLEGTRSLVFLACRNDRFTVTAYAAALTSGHPVLLLDGARPADSLLDLLVTYQPAWLAAPAGTAAALATTDAPVVDVVERLGGELIRLSALAAEPAGVHPDLTLLLSTSGTTGSHKLVRLSTRNIDSNAEAIATMLGLTPDERPITSLPLHYTFGLSVLHSHWLSGAPIVLTTDSVLQKTFWDTFRERACTSLAGVPYTFAMLERIGFRDMDLPTLTAIQQAGGALSPELTATYAAYMVRRGGRLHVMYGQTEATARMAWLPPDRLADKLGSAGRAIRGGRLSIEEGIVDPETGRAVGEVVYEGPNVMLGYATTPSDLALGDVLGGRLPTGDIGWLDDEQFLFIVGRSKRIAKVFGLRVNLDEVELALRDLGPVAVVAGDDAVWAFCAFGTEEQVAELATAMARRFRTHRTALRFQRVDSIPTMGSGKVDYQEVQRWTQS